LVRYTNRLVDQKYHAAVIRPVPGEWHPHMPERLDEQELADWRAGRDALYQLAALTIGARLAVVDAYADSKDPVLPMSPIRSYKTYRDQPLVLHRRCFGMEVSCNGLTQRASP
jgi:hypothetical protein